jgi:hypothetical protein
MNFPLPRWVRTRAKIATGICVGESRVLVAVVSGSAKETHTIDAFEASVGRGGALEALPALAEDPRLAGAIAVGFDPRREIDDTLRLKPEECALSIAELLEARVGRFEGGFAGAMRAVELPQDAVAHAAGTTCVVVSAVPKSFASAAEALASRTSERVLLLPVARALARDAARKTRAPRGWRTVIRVLPAGKRGIAILMSGPHVLAWRLFPWSAPDPVGSIATAARMLASHAREELGLESINGVLVHTAPGDENVAEACGRKLGIPAEVAAPAIVDEARIALALAEAALAHTARDIDLFEAPQAIAPRRRARKISRQAALLGAAALVAGAFLCAIPRFTAPSVDPDTNTDAPAAKRSSAARHDGDGARLAADARDDRADRDRSRSPESNARRAGATPHHDAAAVRELSLDSTLVSPDGGQALISGRTIAVGAAIEGVDETNPPVLAWIDGVRACVRYKSRDYVLDLDRARRVKLDASGDAASTAEDSPAGIEVPR